MHSTSTRKRNTQLRACLFFLLIPVVATISACSSGDRALSDVDPNAVAQNPTFDQVNAIIHNKCVMCHTATSGENGGRVQPLTSCTDIVAQRYDIINRTEDNTMPPGVMPRLTKEELLIIERWVGNGAPAACNPVP
jgi:uncharacterized membrane protein